MINPDIILALLGIDSNEIEKLDFSVDETGNVINCYMTLKDSRGKCPHCKKDQISIKERYTRKIKHTVIFGKVFTIFLTLRRYKCNSCGKTYVQEVRLVEPRRNVSNETIGLIIDELKKKRTFTDIAETFNISTYSVCKILDKDIPYIKRKRLPEVLCIDEFCFKHSGSSIKGKYPVVLSNGLTSEIIDIIESRRKDYLDDYFAKIPLEERKVVKFFVSDMYDEYEVIRYKYFNNSRHIIDLFHVIKAFNEAITRIRIKLIKNEEYKSKAYLFLKKNWKIFLMDRTRASKIKKELKNGATYYLINSIDDALKAFPTLHRVYWDKVEFQKYGKDLIYYSQAEKHINYFINKFQNSDIEEQIALGNTLSKWKVNIIQALTRNEYQIRLTNSRAEANNNVIQTYIDQCYGCTSFTRLRKRILLMDKSK